MKIKFKGNLLEEIREDLKRHSSVSYERVGFLFGEFSNGLLCFDEYFPVSDEDYVKDERYGAVFNKEAIKKVLSLILKSGKSCFQIHEHSEFYGANFSPIDLKTAHDLCVTFNNFNSKVIHGSLVLCGSKISTIYIEVDGKIQKIIGGSV